MAKTCRWIDPDFQTNGAERMSQVMRIAKNAVWLMIVEIMVRACAMLAVMIRARYLGPESFGVLGLAITLSALFQVIPDLGLFNILLRELSKKPEDPYFLIFQSLMMRLAMVIVSWIVLVIFLYGFSGYSASVREFCLWNSITVLTQSWLLIFVATFQCRLEMKFVALINILIAIANLLLTFLLAYYKVTLFYFVILNILYSSLLCIILGYWSKVKYHWPIGWNKIYSTKLLKDAFPLWMAGILTIIFSKIDTIFLSQLSTFESVGLYQAAVKFLEPAQSLGFAIVLSIIPIYIQNMEAKKEKSKLFLESSIKALFVLGWIVVISVNLLGPYILKFCFGKNFSGSIATLKVLIDACVFSFQSAFIIQLLVYWNKQKITILFGFLLVLFNAGINWFCIPIWHHLSAAWTACATEGLQLILLLWIIHRYHIMDSIKIYGVGIMLSLTLFVVLYLQSGVWQWIGLCAWIMGLIAFRMIHRDDIKNLWNVFFKRKNFVVEA